MSMPNHDCKVHTNTNTHSCSVEKAKERSSCFVCLSHNNQCVSLPVCQTRFSILASRTPLPSYLFSLSLFVPSLKYYLYMFLYYTHFNNDLLLLFFLLLSAEWFDNNWSVQCKCFNLICLSTCFNGLFQCLSRH